MEFDWKNFARVAFLSLFPWDRGAVPVTWQNYLGRLTVLVFGGVFELFNGFCYAVDNHFYGNWRCRSINGPIFIIGPPRSGTTFLHRLLALDRERFYFFRTWELIFPSVFQKRALSRLNRLSGGIVSTFLRKVEAGLFRDFNKLHPVSLFAPEEDDYILLHIFSGHDLIWIFPFPELEAYLRFDEMLSAGDRRRIMRFYKKCIQRQAAYLDHPGTYLSKAPANSGRLRSLLESFPDARILYMVRHPLEVIPSMINLAHHVWKKTTGIHNGFPLKEQIYDILKYYYTYPLQYMNANPQAPIIPVSYEDLTESPSRTVAYIYDKLGMELSEKFRARLEEEEDRAKGYRSEHQYSLDEMLIEKERIMEDLKDIFSRFPFLSK